LIIITKRWLRGREGGGNNLGVGGNVCVCVNFFFLIYVRPLYRKNGVIELTFIKEIVQGKTNRARASKIYINIF